jgi:protein-S-isoprenylcysteine O-methyltransferase Ste14
LYTAGIALFLAIGLMAANWFILLCAAIAAILIRTVVVPVEEHELLNRFGKTYLRYIEQTGRLLPRASRHEP